MHSSRKHVSYTGLTTLSKDTTPLTYKSMKKLASSYVSLQPEFPHSLTCAQYPHWTGRRDKRGLPICFFDISYLDAHRMKGYSRSADEVRRALAVHDTLTRFVLPLCSMAGTTTPVSSCLYIVDISAFGLKQAWSLRKYTQDISKLLATSYPEVIDRVWVRAPSQSPLKNTPYQAIAIY